MSTDNVRKALDDLASEITNLLGRMGVPDEVVDSESSEENVARLTRLLEQRGVIPAGPLPQPVPVQEWPSVRALVIAAIDTERERQDAKWGRHPQITTEAQLMKLLVVAQEELGEAAQAALDVGNIGAPLSNVRTELVQTAAVIVKILEALATTTVLR